MTSPRSAHSDGSKRFYTWRNERYWSVTTILQAVPKYALVPWTAKSVAEYACDNIEVVKTLVEAGDRDAAIDMLKRAGDRFRDKKAELGSSVHLAAEAYALGKPQPPWPLEIRAHMEQFAAFLDEYRPEILMTEASVYNRTERYAGTLDMIARFANPKRKLIVDVKTGKNVYPEVALQLAMYRYAEFIGLPDGSQRAMPAVDGAAVLHLGAEGYDLREVDADDNIWRSALYVREVFRFQNETAKHVLGPTIKPPRRRKDDTAAKPGNGRESEAGVPKEAPASRVTESEPEPQVGEPSGEGDDLGASADAPSGSEKSPEYAPPGQTTLIVDGQRTAEQEEALGIDIFGAPV